MLDLSAASHQPSGRNTPCASPPPSTHVHQALGDNVSKAKQNKSAANDCEKEKEGDDIGWLRFVQCHGMGYISHPNLCASLLRIAWLAQDKGGGLPPTSHRQLFSDRQGTLLDRTRQW